MINRNHIFPSPSGYNNCLVVLYIFPAVKGSFYIWTIYLLLRALSSPTIPCQALTICNKTQNYQQEKSESDVNTCPKLPPSHPGPQHFLKQNPHFNFHFLEWFLLPAIIRGMSPHWVKAPPRTSSCSHPQPVLWKLKKFIVINPSWLLGRKISTPPHSSTPRAPVLWRKKIVLNL